MKGCEWMPGSHPDYGMAEPFEHSRKCLSQLKQAELRIYPFPLAAGQKDPGLVR